jgi:hypothetical protein
VGSGRLVPTLDAGASFRPDPTGTLPTEAIEDISADGRHVALSRGCTVDLAVCTPSAQSPRIRVEHCAVSLTASGRRAALVTGWRQENRQGAAVGMTAWS